VQYNVPYGWQFKGARLMAVFPHGSARGGSRSDGPQQIKDLRADDFYGNSHDGNDGSRGSHDTTRNTRTYTFPTFAEATDASEAMRERRADRNKSIAMRVLAAVLILTALGIGMFPRVLQYRSARELASTSARSEKRVAGWPYPQADEAFAAAREYNKRLAKSGQPVIGEAKDPLAELYDDPQNAANNASADGSDNSGDSASAKDKEYQSLLDSGDGVMGAIRIPKISVNLPVYHGTSEQTLASGAGHLYGSSLPVGGKDTHAVITGHRGLVEASMFTRLDEMRVGDYFYIDVMGHTLGYKVDRITEINPDDTSKLKIVPGEDRVTLMTCTPYGVNTHRLLVSALRSAIPEEIPAEDDAAKDVRVIAGVVSAATLLVGLLLVWLLRCPWHVRRHAAWWPKRN
jgi:sortase A